LNGVTAPGGRNAIMPHTALLRQAITGYLNDPSRAADAELVVGGGLGSLQSPGQGFSFQHHLVHKLEVFHIIEVKPGGFVFLCDYKDWQQVYERRAFEKWLAGEANPDYDRFKFVPDPGDVFVISELGVVHTVVGCVLEEYATVSTDMVRRLHDQNEGRAIPASFTRANAERALRAIEPAPRNR